MSDQPEEENIYDVPLLDADLLEDLKALEDLEAGGPTEEPVYEEEDVYKMRELISEKPKDVIQYIEEEGVIKLGEFEIQDSLVFKSFGKEAILTMGDEHLDVDWAHKWRDLLTERGRLTGIGWSTTLTMEAHAVNIMDAAAEGSKGLLQPLLKRFQARGCPVSVFALPAVHAVINFKWTTWARRFLVYELVLYVIWLLAFISFSLLFEMEDTDASLWWLVTTPLGAATVLCNLTALMAMVPFLYMEICTIIVYQLGWFNFWNVLDIACYGLQATIAGIHLHRTYVGESWFSILIAVQHILLWSKLHYFARVFSPTKNLLVDTIRIVIDDMKWFLLFLVLTMLGFAFAFYSLFRQDRETFQDFKSFSHAFASMFSYMLAMFDYNVFYNSTNPTASMILFIIYEFVMNIMLLNIMIAIMTSSFNKVTQDEGLRFLFSKAQIIDELESTLPRWVKHKSWYPPFVHILKVHPDSTYEINLNSVWSGMGLMENNLLNAHQETRLRIEQMEDNMAKINKRLDIMVKVMMSVMSSPAANLHHPSSLTMPSGLPDPAASPGRGALSNAYSFGSLWHGSQGHGLGPWLEPLHERGNLNLNPNLNPNLNSHAEDRAGPSGLASDLPGPSQAGLHRLAVGPARHRRASRHADRTATFTYGRHDAPPPLLGPSQAYSIPYGPSWHRLGGDVGHGRAWADMHDGVGGHGQQPSRSQHNHPRPYSV